MCHSWQSWKEGIRTQHYESKRFFTDERSICYHLPSASSAQLQTGQSPWWERLLCPCPQPGQQLLSNHKQQEIQLFLKPAEGKSICLTFQNTYQTNTAPVRLELKASHCRGPGGRAPVEQLPPTCSGAASSSCSSRTQPDGDVRQQKTAEEVVN